MPAEVTGIMSHHLSNEETPFPPRSFDKAVLRETALAHDAAGFDRVLIAQSSYWPDSMPIASYMAGITENLGFMVAHRPGFVSPTMAARQFATLDQISEGRAAIHVITAANDRETRCDGDFLTKDERYHRGREFVDVLRLIWSSDKPVSHSGRYYKFDESLSELKPFNGSSIPVYWGGSSELGLRYGGECADHYAMGMESLELTRAAIGRAQDAAAVAGRTLQIQGTIRIILGATEAEAWDNARDTLDRIIHNGKERERLTGNAWLLPGGRSEKEFSNAVNNSGQERFLSLTGSAAVQDDNLWVGPQAAGIPMSPALVGTPQQVVATMMRYYAMGMTGFLFRGWDLIGDAREAGRELIPLLKAAALDYDSAQAVSAHG
jgi:alkanesulfonate monooxygenase